MNEPPTFTAKPKHTSMEAGKKEKNNSLLLKNIPKEEPCHSTQNRTKLLTKCKKRKHMSEFEKQNNDKMREEAIAAYRNIKKKSMIDNT